MTPTATLTTSIGTIEITVTDSEHVHAGSRALNVDPLTINGVEHYLSMHLYKTRAGVPEIFDMRTYTDLYMSRRDMKHVSPAARKKAWVVVVEAVNAWLTQHPQALVEAQAAHVAEQIRSRNGKIADLREQIAALEAEITSLSDANYQAVFPQPQEA